jgi:sugar phosphate isomerase/epimerase
MKKPNASSRRKFITTSTALAGGLIVGSKSRVFGAPSILSNIMKPSSVINGVQIGVITYSFRSMDDQSAEATLGYINSCGISAIELMGGPAESFAGMPQSNLDRRAYFRLRRKLREGELSTDEQKEMDEMKAAFDAYGKEVAEWRQNASMEPFEKFRKMYADKGVKVYGFKPSTFGKNNTDAEINYGFKAARALGASHVTLEHPSDDAHTMKLGKMAAKHKIKVAYHGHTQQTPTFWDTALAQSEWNAINPDMGHYVAAGNDQPIEFLRKYSKRIESTHLKDRTTPENGQGNEVWGTGDTPIPNILQLMRDEKYKFPATIELEYKIPEESNAISEVQKCLEFCEKALN